MEKIQILQALFTVEADNLRMLHWKSSGIHFDTAHKIAGDYYDMVGDDIDDIAEVMLRYDINPLPLSNCIQCCSSITMVDPSKDYTVEDVADYVEIIFGEILKGIEVVLGDYQNDIGVKSYFEGLYEKYDKEMRYLNARRRV